MRKVNGSKWQLVLILIVLAVAGAAFLLTNFYMDWLWFGEMGFRSLFIRTIVMKFGLFGSGWILAALFVFLNLLAVRHYYTKFRGDIRVDIFEPEENDEDNSAEEQPRQGAKIIRFPKIEVNNPYLFDFIMGRFGKFWLLLVSAGVGFFFTNRLMSDEVFRKMILFFNRIDFDTLDPIFKNDVSYYTNTVPFLQEIYHLSITVTLVAFILCGAIYLLSGMFLDVKQRQHVINHATSLLIVFFLIMAGGFYLRLATLMISPQGIVTGPGYTDIHVNLPFYYAGIAISVLAAVLAFAARRKQNFKLLLAGPALLIGASVIELLLAMLMQNFIVSPNEIAKETPYIKNNIEYTRMAFDLDNLTEKQYSADNTLTNTDLENASAIINNIRIVDPLPTIATYNQTQSIRSYYNFHDVDVDRYNLKEGYRQVFISAREITANDSMSWINRHIKYTHGYGVVTSPVNRVTKEGQPDFLIRDIPPVSTDNLKLDRPEIYFGEKTDQYIVVQANTAELDYPQGDDNVEAKYVGKAGIKLNMLNRLAFAVAYREIKILISGELNPKSEIVIRRNINERVSRIAPFLNYDNDNYVVIADGRLYWIKDAYTSSRYFPYSEPTASGVNYIRNSVKVVIDAYNGDVSYYVVDDKDPIIAAYMKAFPGVFKNISEMPENLRTHVRYPIDLFKIQAQKLTTYHMTNSGVFYNKEDQWSIANEVYDAEQHAVEPYYAMLDLGDGEEFTLMLPLTPVNKNNMIAWLAVRNDADKFGELLLYKFPKRKLVYGPMQIEARISQDQVISPQLTLWGQQGSSVMRGSLFVIPIKDSILYVEPLYLQATSGQGSTALPEMKKVVVVYGDRVIMQDTLAQALSVIFKGVDVPDIPDGEAAGELTPKKLIDQANQQFQDAQKAVQQGDWTAYGQLMQELQKTLEKLKGLQL